MPHKGLSFRQTQRLDTADEVEALAFEHGTIVYRSSDGASQFTEVQVEAPEVCAETGRTTRAGRVVRFYAPLETDGAA